jgi:hypothetical protein
MTTDRSKTGLEVLQVAVLLGILGDVMLRHMPWGLNVLLVVAALGLAMLMLMRRHKPEFWSPNTAALISAMTLFGACFAWRDSLELRILDSIAIVTILAVQILPSLRLNVHLSGVYHYVIGFFWSGLNAAFGPFVLLFNDIEWAAVSKTGWQKHLVAVLRGAAIAAPLLFIFGGLFVAADAVFEGIIKQTLNIDPALILQHSFLIALFAWLSAGYLRGIVSGSFTADVKETFLETTKESQPVSSEEAQTNAATKPVADSPENKNRWNWREPNSSSLPDGLTLGPIEIGVSMGLINLLFLGFVIVQLPYLFGGFELVQQTENLKLADYARRGFGELVTVAALVLPILLFSHWLLRRESRTSERLYRIMAGIQIVLLFVIMASAAQRLFVLTGNLGYGLTTVRFYPMVFMIWLAVVFILFAVTVLRGLRARFAWGALWSALCVLGLLHFVNPDDYIVRTNVRLMREGRAFDADYNSRLSADSIPVILEAFPETRLESIESSDSNRRTMNLRLKQHYCDLRETSDPRSWSLARWRAKRAFERNGNWDEIVGDCAEFRSYQGFD